MASAAQITANRANSQLSTGPKTPEGRLASSRNAVRHGFTSISLSVAPEDQAEFDQFRQDLLADVRPEGALEDSLFERLLLAHWNLRRITRYETGLLDETNPFAPGNSEQAAAFDRLARYRRDLERSSQRALAELRKLQTERVVLLQQADVVVDKLYNSAPLVELTRLTGDTDNLIFGNTLFRGTEYHKSRQAASTAARNRTQRTPRPAALPNPHPAASAAAPAPNPFAG